MEKHGVRAVPLGFPGYPPPLAACVGPAAAALLSRRLDRADANAVGMVGSRSCTSYGLRIAAQIARDWPAPG